MKFISQSYALAALRIGVSIIMILHGLQRLYFGTVGEFGGWLNSKGFLIGVALAWTVTLFEICGGVLLALGYFRRIICFGWMGILIMGIIMVHLPNGWFVVGPSSGGVEYSFLLLLCLTVIASQGK
jgi:putative oxidoreductase